MPQVTFRSGNPSVCEHTPGAAVSAGDVIVTADTPRIALVDIAANALGSLATEGGIYECTGDAAIAVDKKVYWNDSANKVTETSSGNKMFGVTVSACSGGASTCLVRHDPAA